MTTGPKAPSLFHKLLCLQPQELSPEEFYASLYQFTYMCWVSQTPSRPWNSVPIPLEYDPTSPMLHHQVDLHKIFLHVMAVGGSDRVTATDGWRRIGHITGMNVIDDRPGALATVCKVVYYRYIHCYEVYGEMVRTIYWEHRIKPNNYPYVGTRQQFLHSDSQWGEYIPDVGIRSRLFVNLPTQHSRRYSQQLLELRQAIKWDTAKASERLVYQDVDLHLFPDPEPLPVVNLDQIFKKVVEPGDSVSNHGGDYWDDRIGVKPFTAYDLNTRSYSPPLDPMAEVESQRLMSRNRRELFFMADRKLTPPPPTVSKADELVWDSDSKSCSDQHEEEGFPTLTSRLEDYINKSIEVDHKELEEKYGIFPYASRPESSDQEESLRAYDFGDFHYFGGMQALMPLWREWIMLDPGFHSANCDVDTQGGYDHVQVNFLPIQDEAEEPIIFKDGSVSWNGSDHSSKPGLKRRASISFDDDPANMPVRKTNRPEPEDQCLHTCRPQGSVRNETRCTQPAPFPKGLQNHQETSFTPKEHTESSNEAVISFRDAIFMFAPTRGYPAEKAEQMRQLTLKQLTWDDMKDVEYYMEDDDIQVQDLWEYEPYLVSRKEWDRKAVEEWQIAVGSTQVKGWDITVGSTQKGTVENPLVIGDDSGNEREVSLGTVGGMKKRKREDEDCGRDSQQQKRLR
ncbi:hypothetical protein BDD12DRAFT_875784 [Trichophaea hybrida]|nr:hypothetical protein BDD12DRAFT_875784 [Trichophaea hybrida]